MLKHYNADCNIKSLPVLDGLLKNNYKNIALILLDGFGMNILNTHLKRGDFLFDCLNRAVSSVFPPTTTAATVSLLSGTFPITHAWLGWSLYFRELDKNVCIFPNTVQGTKDTPAASYNVAEKLIPYESIFNKIHKTTDGGVSAESIYPFGKNMYKSAEEMFGRIKALCERDGKKFIYAYINEPDALIHKNGINHTITAETVRYFSRLTEQLCKNLHKTLVIITADHGLIDTEYKYMTDYPHICECLERPQSIESRALGLFVKNDKRVFFKEAFNHEFGNDFKLLSKDDVLNMKFFGDAPVHPRVTDFLGDFFAVATGKLSIDNACPAHREVYKAMHAGLTEDEIAVPLIIADCL